MRLFADQSPPFAKVLVANRGEIAVRVMRALRDLGVGSVAVYSEPDRSSLHVRVADEAVALGGRAAAESYLVVAKIHDAAHQSGAEAIHPGYGFLSESATFAQAVLDAGLVWIGPPPEAIRLAGNKLGARRVMTQAGVAVVPGSDLLKDEADLAAAIAKVGFPAMLKAAAGGGGKGMRLVRDASELASAWRSARSEARSFFADDTVYLERYIESPRHIEVQVLADAHGRILHLGERECSVQRRHQKVIEEAPSPLVDAKMRDELGRRAVEAARAVGYVNAGTVECIADASGQFYFLEMNTRIQVEHPVTEMVTGIDLVRAQVLIAAGRPLAIAQADIAPRGHALECRIYAEDPERGYMPSPGTITALRVPEGPGVRHDAGITVGSPVPLEYDPILAKLVVWGADREEAIQRMRRALGEYRVGGVTTNLSLHLRVLDDPRFLSGRYDTGLLASGLEPAARDDNAKLAAVVAAAIAAAQKRDAIAPASASGSAWLAAGRRAAMRRPR